MDFKFFFRWYDLWIGLFVDVSGPVRVYYVCPLPMLGVRIQRKLSHF